VRLQILDSHYSLGTKALFALIRMTSRQPVPDAAKLTFYRPDFYGTPMKLFTHAAMRGPSAWSIGDRVVERGAPLGTRRPPLPLQDPRDHRSMCSALVIGQHGVPG